MPVSFPTRLRALILDLTRALFIYPWCARAIVLQPVELRAPTWVFPIYSPYPERAAAPWGGTRPWHFDEGRGTM